MFFLTRVACLGGWVLGEKFGDGHLCYNQQKTRVDMFLDIINGKQEIPPTHTITSLLIAETDMSHMYLQSEKLPWLKESKKPDAFFMDNFSELVDKKFIHKDGWSFCGYYSDFDPNCFINNTFTDDGLLDPYKIYDYYNLFFKYIKEKWDIPIIFIHFPTLFEDREKYINQAKAITEALEVLTPVYDIQNIHADTNEIVQRIDNPQTYHFGQRTIKNMANKIIW